MKPIEVYRFLFGSYGGQGWWPLIDCNGNNPTKTGSIQGYHPGDYSYPRTVNQRFEICLGAIATQNTSWIQTEKALLNLKKLGAISPKILKKVSEKELKDAIKPAGYFNQKAKKIRLFTDFYLGLNGKTPTREELLNMWGIGPETADSMLLYAFKVPTFVVDAYTKRIFHNLGFIKEKATYDEIKQLFESSLKPDLVVYQEYHALIVEHAKRYYQKKGEYHKCPLFKEIAKAGGKTKLK